MAYGNVTGWKNNDKMKWDETSEGGSRKVPPAGSYECRVEKATPQLSKEKQTPMISVRLKLLSTENPDIEDGVDCIVFDNWMFDADPKANFRTKNFARVAELDMPDSNSYDDVSAFAEEAVGMKVPVEIKGDSYQGKPTAKVDYYGAEPPPSETEKSNGKGRTSGRDSRREEKRSGGRDSGRRR